MELINDKQFRGLKDFNPNTILTASSLDYKLSQIINHNNLILSAFGGAKLVLEKVNFNNPHPSTFNKFKKAHKRYNNAIVALKYLIPNDSCNEWYPTELSLIQCVNDVEYHAKQLLILCSFYYGSKNYNKAIRGYKK